MSSAPDHPLSDRPLDGQFVVFTGKLSLLGRKEAGALVARLGGIADDEVSSRTTMLVIGSEGVPASALRGVREAVDEPEREESPQGGLVTNKLRKAERLNATDPGRIKILTEQEFCGMVGLPAPDVLRQQYYPLRDVLGMYSSIREDHIRYLQKWGLVRPVLRTNAQTYFTFSDLSVIKQADTELREGGAFRAVLRSLLAARSGQLVLDFRLDAEPAKILRLRRSAHPADTGAGVPPEFPAATRAPHPDPALAERFFAEGSRLDNGDEKTQEPAATAYRKALELDPYLVAALINLANIHYARNELAEAQALYERAIGLEPDFFEAHFNLGNIYHDLGDYPDALACYRRAIALNPRYAEAHFYLAVTCEKMGLSHEAKPHWRAYQQLDPGGEWVALAKEFSE